MKRLLSLLVTAVMLVSGYGGAMADTIRLPQKIRRIESEAFSGDLSLDTVDIPWGAETIGSRAFADSGAKTVYIPDTVFYIADDAFAGTNAVLRASEDSYARQYAENNGLTWQSCGDHYGQENQNDFDNVSEGSLALDYTDQQDLAYLSAENAEDQEELAAVAAYNAFAEQMNELSASFATGAADMNSGLEALVGELPQMTGGQTGNGVSYSIGFMDWVVDQATAQALQNGVEITGSETSEEGDAIVLSGSDGNSYYLTMAGSAVYLSRTPDSPIIPREAVITARAVSASETLRQKFLFLVNKLETAASYINNVISYNLDFQRNKLANLQQNLSSFKSKVKDMELKLARLEVEMQYDINPFARDEYNRYLAKYNRYAARVEKLKGLIKNAEDWVSRWSKVSRYFSKANIIMTIPNLFALAERWGNVNAIGDHKHPNSEDNYPERIDTAIQLKKDVLSLQWLYGADLFASVLQLVSDVLVLASAVATAGTGGAAAPSLLISGALAVCAFAANANLQAREDRLYTAVTNADEQLHSSVWGVVTDEDTDEPLRGVAVTNGISTSITEEDGVYRLRIPPGNATLVFTSKDYKKDAAVVTLPPNKEIRKDMKLKKLDKQACISGVVRDQNTDQPIAGACVRCDRDTVYTTENGEYSFVVEAGEYYLDCTKEGYIGYSDTITLEENEIRFQDIHLRHGNEIWNRQDLENVASNPNGEYILCANIDLSGAPWTPLPWFGGVFEGNGHSIDGMKIRDGNDGNVGLFQGLYGGTVRNLTMTGIDISVPICSSFTNVGGLGGGLNNGSQLYQCYLYGSITVTDGDGDVYVGGLGSFAGDCDIARCITGVSITVSAHRNVFAGGLVGSVGSGKVKNSLATVTMDIRQTTANSGAAMFANGTSFFNGELAYNCNAEGSVRLETIDATGYAYGVCRSDWSENRAQITAVTASGTVSAYGCYDGSCDDNHGKITSTATGSGTVYAAGLWGIGKGQNSGEVSAVTASGTADASGATNAGSRVKNTASVSAKATNGTANACGISGQGQTSKSFKCTNSGSVTATCGSGNALGIGMAGCMDSENSGSVSVTADTGNAVGQGMSRTHYSKNTGSVTVIYKGTGDVSGGLSCQGLNTCVASKNYGKISGRVLASLTAATVTGIEKNCTYCENHGDVEAESLSGPANARGVMGSSSQNYGAVFAYSAHTSGLENANATAYGVITGTNSLNAGQVTAISKSSVAHAYGCADGLYGSVSTGAVSAESERFETRTTQNSFEVWIGQANARNSASVTAKVGSYSASASGNSRQNLYFFAAASSCSRHAGMARGFVSLTPNSQSLDGCYIYCGSVYAVTYDDYVMPEIPPCPAEE